MFWILSFLPLKTASQNDTVNIKQSPTIHLSGFLDAFYVHDFNQSSGGKRQAFLFNHNRKNEVNVNLGLVKMTLEHTKYRANLALQTGTYAYDNYAAEPNLLKHIAEANVGFSLNKQNNFWVDAGVFPAHIGFESAVSVENPTLTRSLLAENSPYFSTGIKFTSTPNHKWEFAALIINAWQRIAPITGNSLPSFGTQVIYKPQQNVLLNWSTFLGTDDPDIHRRMRYFHNLFAKIQVSKRFNITAGADIGMQQTTLGSKRYHLWFTTIFIGQYVLNTHWKTALRAEYYQDESGVILPFADFKTSGFSWNIDYVINASFEWRIEGRLFQNKTNIFATEQGLSATNYFIATAITFYPRLGITKLFRFLDN